MAEKKCRNCKEWVPQKTVICPHCKERASIGPIQGTIIITVLLLIAAGIYLSSKSSTRTPVAHSQQLEVKTIYSPEQIKSAEKIMATLNTLAKVYEEGGHLVVEFANYLFPENINKRLDFVRAVADADCVLKRNPRSIFFYNPGNKLIAKADKVNGVRLE